MIVQLHGWGEGVTEVTTKSWLTALAALAACIGLAATASAHTGSARTVTATSTTEGVTLEIAADKNEAAVANGLGDELTEDTLVTGSDMVQLWTVSGIEVQADAPCEETLSEPRIVGDSVVVELLTTCGPGERSVSDVSLSDGHQTIVSVSHPDGNTSTVILNGPDDAASVSTPITALQAAGTFVVQGAIHLVTGFDHMLFVLSLLFAAGLVSREHGSKKALRNVAWIITAFTVGHSITLVVASLGLVTLPSQLVEASIAASIIVVAVMNVLRPDETMGRAHIALGFGLIHGFGFSSVLADVGLPAQQHAVALLSFNVGIELAQLTFVALALVPLAWLARKSFYRPVVMQGGSIVIALCATYWLVERVLGV